MKVSLRIIVSTTALLIVLLFHSTTSYAQSEGAASRAPGDDSASSRPTVEQRLQNIEQKLLELETRLNAASGQTRLHSSSSSPSSTREPTLDERFDALDQQVRMIERKRASEQEAAAAKTNQTPVVVAGKEGFSLKSADGNFQLKLRGYFQSDSRWFFEDDAQLLPIANTFVLRRVRPIVEGTVFKYFDFRIMTDFGGGQATVQDLHLDARFWPKASFRFGKYKAPFSLERLQSATDLMFIERAYPTSLAPNRDLGFQVYGDFGGGVLNYQAGVFNGVVDGGSGDLDERDGKDFIARVFAHPFRKSKTAALQGLGIGIAGNVGRQNGNLISPNLPTYRTTGQQVFFRYRLDLTLDGTTIADGQRYRVSPQAYYYTGPFGLMTEYVLTSQEVRRGATTAQMKNDAWQVTASYVLTGEKQSYRGLTPGKDFDLKANTYGAFEIAGRYHQLKVDGDAFPLFANPQLSARKAEAWAVGLNWYFNRNVKLVLNYEQTNFDGGSPTGDRKTEKALLNRFQIAF